MITSIRMSSGPVRPKPRMGDTKLIKGVLHERRLKYVFDTRGNRLGLDCTGGRQRYEWLPVTAKQT